MLNDDVRCLSAVELEQVSGGMSGWCGPGLFPPAMEWPCMPPVPKPLPLPFPMPFPPGREPELPWANFAV